METKQCSHCKLVKPLSEFNRNGHKKFKDGHSYYCKACDKLRYREYATKCGIIGMVKNRKCTQYLGIHAAERVLAIAFPDVRRMPFGNPGYDYLCPKGFKIDVKASCLRSEKNSKDCRWAFHIERNQVADYFLLIAFNNRNDLDPQHVWLIPGNEINSYVGIGISVNTLQKWSKWEKPIDKVVSCCNTLKAEA